jgi:O-antigen/teichoic acid export membrane protein
MTEPVMERADTAPTDPHSEARVSLRRLGKQTTIYSIATLLGRAVSFIMLPVYTRYLTPADFGVLQLLDMTVDVAALLLTAGATAGTQRFYFKADTEAARKTVVSSAFLLGVSFNLIVTIVLAAGAGWVWRAAFKGAGTPEMIRLAAVNFSLASLTTIPTLLLVMRQKPVVAVSASLAKLVLQLTLNILFVVGFRLGPLGVLLSTCAAGILVGGTLAVWLLKDVGAAVDSSLARSLLRFGLPYQLSTAGSFIVTFGDRFFLNASYGVAVVGLYSLAYSFGFILHQLATAPFMTAWEPNMFRLAKLPAAERDARYNQGLLVLSLFQATGAVGIALTVPLFLRVMATPPFFAAADVVPVVLLAYVLQSLTFLLKFGIDVSERTVYFTAASWASVVVTLALYWFMIPRWGMHGAAWATVGGFAVRGGLIYWWAQRLWRIEYRWAPVLRLLAAGVATVALVGILPGTTFQACIVKLAGGFSLYLALAWSLGLTAGHRAMLLEAMRAPREALAKLTA